MLNKVFIGLIAFLVVVSGGLGYWSSSLNGRISTLNDDTQAFKADTAGQFSTVKSSITSVDSGLTSLKTDTADKFTGVQSDITGVRNNVTNLNADLSAFKSDTTSKLNSAQSSINALNTDLTNLGTQVDESTMNVRQVYDDVIGSVCEIIGNTATGSGFIYSADGLVITCWHVIDGQTSIYVVMHDGSAVRATVVGSDQYSDIAVLRLTGKTGLTPLTLADSSALVNGEPVIVVGNPLGIFESVTYGVISRTKGMELSEYGWYIRNLIQFDAPANPGNSGGPVFNKEGQVIGIVSSGYNYRDISFAVSSNKIKRVAQSILDNGSFTNAIPPGTWTIGNLTPETALQRGLNSSFGIIFTQATGVGQVQTNDICTAIDGIAIKDYADFFSYIAQFKSVGDTIKLSLIRGSGTKIEVSLTLVEGHVV